jgi:hypothetical protein
MLYKVSIALGYSPKRWTDSKVIFIAKPNKSNYTDPNAFRPISLCSFILKGLERVVLFHIEDTNLSSNPFCDAQHAFRRGRSTETALSEAVDKIESGLLKQQYALAVFLDIAGAFNNLTFNAATKAMRKRGLPNNIITWYSHFLHNQESTMELGDSRFSRKLVVGAPQGGVMSPTVWNINFDPILKKLNTNKPVKVIGYADDALIMITGHVPEVMVKRIQPSINAMVDWGVQSGLKFNHSKTQVVLFTNKKAREYRAKVTINDLPIDFSAEAKYLGIVLIIR